MDLVTAKTSAIFAAKALHVTVSLRGSESLVPSVVAGVIGGATALAAALIVNHLERRREQTQRFKDEVFNVFTTGTDIFVGTEGLGPSDLERRSALFVTQLSRLVDACGPPQWKWREKKAVTKGIFIRYVNALPDWKSDGLVPNHEMVFGSELDPFVAHKSWWTRRRERS